MLCSGCLGPGKSMDILSRRTFVIGSSALGVSLGLGGCASTPVRTSDIDPAYRRTVVRYNSREAPGTAVVDPQNHFLYFVQRGGTALRYGVGVGAEGFGWSGVARVHSKQEWPDWYPPEEMLRRKPELRRSMTALQSGIGMRGGPKTPSVPGHFIFGRATRILCTGFTAPTSRKRSARMFLRVAFA